MLRRGLAIAAGCAVAALAAGCEGSGGSPVVVRVGDHEISKATIDHWTSVIQREGAFSSYRGEPDGTPKQRALALLISSQWLIDEAAHQGVPISEDAVTQLLAVREREIGVLREQISRTGQTVADVKLELCAELAAEALRRKLASRAAIFSPQEITAFYRANPLLFGTGSRLTHIVEGQPTAAAAVAAIPRLQHPDHPNYFLFTPVIMRSPEITRAAEAIFRARPGVIAPPVLMNEAWSVFIVKKVIPGRIKPLAQVRPEVVLRLSEHRQQETASSFDHYYTARWKALTSCRSTYVGPGCPQYTQPLGAYEDPFSTKQRLLLSEPLSRT